MKNINDFLPWKVTDISFRPYEHFWSFNPSIHFDGKLWRCVLRCADYCMRDGETVRGPRSVPGQSQTKNAMVILDPASWRPVEIYKMRERDAGVRVACPSVGYEDIRIFRSDRDGLQGIAASLHLRRGDRQRNQHAEQVLLTFDAEYNVVEGRAIRGSSWGSTPQKNWVPFDHCTEPRFLYSIGDGTVFNERGPVAPEDVRVRPSRRVHAPHPEADERARRRARRRAAENLHVVREEAHRRGKYEQTADPRMDWKDLRGGSQLVRVGEDAWLGIGHAMKFVDAKKMYWHIWYLVNSLGKLQGVSAPMKLAPNGIEFAAGLVVDGDRVVVSFGVDDMECKIGETKLGAVLGVLRKMDVER